MIRDTTWCASNIILSQKHTKQRNNYIKQLLIAEQSVRKHIKARMPDISPRWRRILTYRKITNNMESFWLMVPTGFLPTLVKFGAQLIWLSPANPQQDKLPMIPLLGTTNHKTRRTSFTKFTPRIKIKIGDIHMATTLRDYIQRC